MMTTQECIQALQTQYQQDTAQAANISKLTSDAWGANKTECMQSIGGVSQIRDYLDTATTATVATTQNATPIQQSTTLSSLIPNFQTEGLIQGTLHILLILVLLYIIGKF